MARCQCPGTTCGCSVVGGPGVTVEGVGSAERPYVVSSAPNVYQATLTAVSTPYRINELASTEVGSRALFLIEIDPALTKTVFLPDGSSSTPYPEPGAVIDVLVSGTIASSQVNFGGAVVTWYGPAPTTSTLGWYTFIYKGNNTFAGTWTPYR